MGSFDRIYLAIRCPYCGDTDTKEIQTKELHNFMDSYAEGDEVDTDKDQISGLAICRSDPCILSARVRDAKGQGTYSGFGVSWGVVVFIKHHKITNVVKATDIKKNLANFNWIYESSHPEKMLELIEQALEEYSSYAWTKFREDKLGETD